MKVASVKSECRVTLYGRVVSYLIIKLIKNTFTEYTQLHVPVAAVSGTHYTNSLHETYYGFGPEIFFNHKEGGWWQASSSQCCCLRRTIEQITGLNVTAWLPICSNGVWRR